MNGQWQVWPCGVRAHLWNPAEGSFSELLKDVEDNSSFKENQANESGLVGAGWAGAGGGERL